MPSEFVDAAAPSARTANVVRSTRAAALSAEDAALDARLQAEALLAATPRPARRATPTRDAAAKLAAAVTDRYRNITAGRLLRSAAPHNERLAALDREHAAGKLNPAWYARARAELVAERAAAVTRARLDLARELNASVLELDRAERATPPPALTDGEWRALAAAKDVVALDPAAGVAALRDAAERAGPALARELVRYAEALASTAGFALDRAPERHVELRAVIDRATEAVETPWGLARDAVAAWRDGVAPQLDLLAAEVGRHGEWTGAPGVTDIAVPDVPRRTEPSELDRELAAAAQRRATEAPGQDKQLAEVDRVRATEAARQAGTLDRAGLAAASLGPVEQQLLAEGVPQVAP